MRLRVCLFFFFFQAEDGIRDYKVTGVQTCALPICVILYLTYWYPAHRRAKIVALFMSAIPVAGIFGNPLSGWIMQAFHGDHGLHGWQWMFLIEAIPALVIGVVTILDRKSTRLNSSHLVI